MNVGDNGSLLNWTVNNTMTWGTWTFSRSSGENLTPEMRPGDRGCARRHPEGEEHGVPWEPLGSEQEQRLGCRYDPGDAFDHGEFFLCQCEPTGHHVSALVVVKIILTIRYVPTPQRDFC